MTEAICRWKAYSHALMIITVAFLITAASGPGQAEAAPPLP